MTEPTHLLPVVRPQALAPTEERILRIRADRWIGYTRAAAALAALDDLMSHPPRARMPNLVLVGPTNNGKTMIVEKFYRQYISTCGDFYGTGLEVPVLKVQMPDSPDAPRFFLAIMRQLGAGHLNERPLFRYEMAMRLMQAAHVRLLIIDEFHNALAGHRVQQRRFLNLIRWLGNELRIPIAAVGTIEALRAIQSDDQLANRFVPFALPLWQAGEEYSRLLNTLEAVLPLRRRSALAAPALANRIMALAEGVLGEIVTIVTAAAVHALRSGSERIEAGTIEALTFQSPSQRRHAAG